MGAPDFRPNPLDQALRYLSLGLSIIPIKAREKRPALSSWKEFQKRKPTEKEVRGWFAEDSNLNLAIVTGTVSRVVVIDGDSPEAVSWLATNHPSPVRTETSKGRKHFWFLHPGHEVRNNAKIAGMALDVRGDGGYVVAPGSIHSSGDIYTEEGDWSDLDSLPVFNASWLSEKVQPLVNPQDAMEKRVRAYLANTPGAIQGQGGDAHTFRVACKLVREFALPEDQALAYLCDWNSKCAPAWSMIDLRKKIASALQSGTAPIGSKLDAQPPRPNTWRPPMGEQAESVDAGGAGNLDELLHRNDKGKIQKTSGNLSKILRLHHQWGTRLALNEMTRDVIYDGQVVGDVFVDWVQEQIEDAWHLSFGREDIASKILAQASCQPIHPVREWLRKLPPWDGEERIRRIAPEIIGDSSPLAFQYVFRTMVGAVRRVFFPGTKMDTVLVLTGAQGSLKSTFFKVLAGEENFGDSPVDLESKEGPMVLHRSWFNEFAEIDHVTSNRDVERLKAFLSTSKDIFRPTYGRSVGVFPRSCVIVGTANKDELLVDPTGSRRFWPIKIGKTLDLTLLSVWREQLWAEALDAYHQGVEHWLPRDMEMLRVADAKNFEAEDPWESQVDQAVSILSRAGHLFGDDGVSTADLLSQMGIPVSQQTRGSSMKVAQILKGMGWKGPVCIGERRLRRLFPPSTT